MVAKCANPGCKRQFRYLREGRLFAFRDPRLDQQVQYWWLCPDCTSMLSLHLDPKTGIQVARRTKVEKNECTRSVNLQRPGLVESYCNRCGRFLGASSHKSALTVAEEVHQCAPCEWR